MLSDPFVLRLLLSFVMGGLAVALFTAAAERHGSRLGGLLLSFPVKVVVSLVLIGLNEGVPFATRAAVAVPTGIGVNVVFLVATALLVRRFAPWPAMGLALLPWATAGLLAVVVPPQGLAGSLACWAVATAASLALLGRIPGIRTERRTKGAGRFGATGLLTRAAGAGSVVALSVLLAHHGGPLLGGLASVFPSGWMTTMVILTRKHGPEFTGATTRVMVAGSAAPAGFGAACALLYPHVGLAGGTLLALAGAGALSAGIGWLLGREPDAPAQAPRVPG